MENSDAAQMVGEWGCNNVILGENMSTMMKVLMMAVMIMMLMATTAMFNICYLTHMVAE